MADQPPRQRRDGKEGGHEFWKSKGEGGRAPVVELAERRRIAARRRRHLTASRIPLSRTGAQENTTFQSKSANFGDFKPETDASALLQNPAPKTLTLLNRQNTGVCDLACSTPVTPERNTNNAAMKKARLPRSRVRSRANWLTVYHTERVHPRQKIRPPLRVSARGRRRRAEPPRGAAPPGSLTRSGGVPLECLGARAVNGEATTRVSRGTPLPCTPPRPARAGPAPARAIRTPASRTLGCRQRDDYGGTHTATPQSHPDLGILGERPATCGGGPPGLNSIRDPDPPEHLASPT